MAQETLMTQIGKIVAARLKAVNDRIKTYTKATAAADGLMSKEDKAKLDGLSADTCGTAAEFKAAWNAVAPQDATLKIPD